MKLSSRQRRLVLESDESLRVLGRQISAGDYGLWKDYLQMAHHTGKFSRNVSTPIGNLVDALELVPPSMLIESSESLLGWLKSFFNADVLNDPHNNEECDCFWCVGPTPSCRDAKKFFQRIENNNREDYEYRTVAGDLVGFVCEVLNKRTGDYGNVKRNVDFILGHIIGS